MFSVGFFVPNVSITQNCFSRSNLFCWGFLVFVIGYCCLGVGFVLGGASFQGFFFVGHCSI